MWNERNVLMFGAENVRRLADARVLVVGVGGVGAYAAEMIARAGVGHMVLVDADVVNETNINRQLIALHSTIGSRKVDILAERMRDINPEIDVETRAFFLKDEKTDELLDSNHFDYVIDAIDTLSPKVFLLFSAFHRGIPVASSMGSGGKVDPSRVRVDDISKSNYCKLARMVRKRLHHLGVREGIKVVYSDEVVSHDVTEQMEGEQNKLTQVGTVSYMPAIFGCCLASIVIRDLIYDKGRTDT